MFDRRRVFIFKCDNEGHSHPRMTHYFIILSDFEYNSRSHCILAIPITDEKTYFSTTYGFQLSPDDFEGGNNKLVNSYVLCDRPCRVKRLDISRDDDGQIRNKGIIRKITIDKILNKVISFMKSGS